MSRRLVTNLRHVLLVVLLCGLLGCGYTLMGKSTSNPMGQVALTLPPVLNQAREPGLEHRITAALRRAVIHNPRLRLTSDADASHQLQSTVKTFRTFAISFDSSDNVVQYRIETDAHIRLVDRDSDQPLLVQTISAWAEYLVSPTGSVRENDVARTAAVYRLAEQLAAKCTALIDITLL